jgi:acetate kinase
VVHGGWRFEAPTRITAEVIRGIREVSTLAPLHNNLALAGIEAGERLLPGKPAVAVFDTAFHRTMPDVSALYAIPFELAKKIISDDTVFMASRISTSPRDCSNA